MPKIFRVYAANGGNRFAEMDLPASGYEMLDLMERLHLAPGKIPYLEVLEYSEQYDYLEKCVHELPDIFQLNALANKLSAFTSVQDMAAFEGLVGREIQQKTGTTPLPRLIDLAYSTEGCALAEEVMTDFQLGKFLVENGFIEEADGLPEAMIALLDFVKIGREHREAEGGVFTGFGYVEQFPEVRNVSAIMEFQPRKPPYTILLQMMKLPAVGELQESNVLQLRLPAPEAQMREALDKLGAEDWNGVAVFIQDSPIPCLNHHMYLNGETPRLMELAQCLQTLDGQGELTQYKAVLEANNWPDLPEMLRLAGTVDAYVLEPQTGSPEDAALGELEVIMGSQDAETLLPYIDLTGYGRALLERDHAVMTEYGLLGRRPQQAQAMEQEKAPEGMAMV